MQNGLGVGTHGDLTVVAVRAVAAIATRKTLLDDSTLNRTHELHLRCLQGL